MKRTIGAVLVIGMLLAAVGCRAIDGASADVAAVGGGIEILEQFVLETETPIAKGSYRRAPLGLSQIAHPDPLELAAASIEVVSDRVSADVTAAITSAFGNDGFRGSVTSTLSDADVALGNLCRGVADVAVISGPSSGMDSAQCDREIAILPIATDRMVVAAHPDNFWIGQVTAAQLPSLMTGSSWNDVETSWPRRPMTKFLPPLGSDQMDLLLNAAVMERSTSPAAFAGAVFESDTDERLRRVAADPSAVTVVPVASLRRSSVDFVERSLSSLDPLRPGLYPAERTLYVAVAQDSLLSSSPLATLVAYLLNRVELEARDHYLVVHDGLPDTREHFVAIADDLGLSDGLAPLLTVRDAQT